MTFEPAIVIAFITAILGLLGYILREALAGNLTNPNKVVPRADYEELRKINASYPEAIDRVAAGMKKLATTLGHVADNGNKDSH